MSGNQTDKENLTPKGEGDPPPDDQGEKKETDEETEQAKAEGGGDAPAVQSDGQPPVTSDSDLAEDVKYRLPPPVKTPTGPEPVGAALPDDQTLATGGTRPKAHITYRTRRVDAMEELSGLLGQLSIQSPGRPGEVTEEDYYRLVQRLEEFQSTMREEVGGYREALRGARRETEKLREELMANEEEIANLRAGANFASPQVERDPVCDAILLSVSANPLPSEHWPALNPQLAQYLATVGTWPVSPVGDGSTFVVEGKGAPRDPSPRQRGGGAARRTEPQDAGASPLLQGGAESQPSNAGSAAEERERERVRAEREATLRSRRVSWNPATRGGHCTPSPVGTYVPQNLPVNSGPSSSDRRFASLEQRLEDMWKELRSGGIGGGRFSSTPAAQPAPRYSYGTCDPHAPPMASQSHGGWGRYTAGASPYGGERTLPLPPNTRLAPESGAGEMVVASDVKGMNLVGVHVDDRSRYPCAEMDPLGYFVGRRIGSPITQGYGRADIPLMTAQLDLTLTLGMGYGFGRPEERYQGVDTTLVGGKERESRHRTLGKLVKLDFPMMNNVDEAYLWSQWHTKFVGLARALQLSYEEMGYLLTMYLSQCVRAAQAVNTLPSVLASDYNTLVTLAANLFCPSSRAVAAQAKLHARVQSGETAQQFAVSLLKLVEAAYPCSRVAYTSERRQEAALRRFCEGLTDRALALRLLDHRCTTIQQALSLVDEYTVTMQSAGGATPVMAVTSVSSADSELLSGGEDPSSALEVFAVTRKDAQVRSNGPAVPSGKQASGSQGRRNRNKKKNPRPLPQTRSRTPPSNVARAKSPNRGSVSKEIVPAKSGARTYTCWSCGREGHMMRECTLKSGRTICFIACEEHLDVDLPEDF